MNMEHLVTAAEQGMALRDVLRRVMGVSYSAMKSAKWNGRILVNGAARTVDARLTEGDLVTFLPKEAEPQYSLKPYDLRVRVVWEDEYLLVADKPAPLASQSSLGHPDDSLENALFAHYGCPEGFLYRPVNRLDKGTSGLMVIAKDAHSQHRLQQLLHTEDFQRSYLAVTEGVPDPAAGVVDAPIAKADEASIRRVVSPEGKPSVTHYEVLQERRGRALVSLRLETGRTHQIRVHMAHLGCPVAGDFLYGTELPELPGRFALHSHRLLLRHPLTGELLDLTSPMPP